MSKKSLVTITIASVLCVLIVGYFTALFRTAEISFEESNFPADTVEVFSEYKTGDVTSTVTLPLFFSKKLDADVIVTGEVDTDKPGEYTLHYEAVFLSRKAQKTHTVKVVDTTPPEIETEENFVELVAGAPKPKLEDITITYTAKDNYDGNLTDRVEKRLEDEVFYLFVTDSSGNLTEKEIPIVYKDNRGPVIKLLGCDPIYMAPNTVYKEPGYTITDNIDKDIADKLKIENGVNVSKPGTYAVVYSATDSSGNTTTVTRKVVVINDEYDDKFDTVEPNGRVIYLTFDDGPSIYTEELLGILKKYRVKATFFVTNQKPQYQHLIGQIHREGHSIGVHTLTHKWELYKSVDSYLADFNAMNKIIEEQTGAPSKIFRFPGGTNNEISRKHCPGIMTTLSNLMKEKGYVYYDWNVSSEDTSLTDPSAIVNTLISQIKNKNRSMILAHDIKSATVKAMPAFIEYCLKNGYRFEIITEKTAPIVFKPRN